MKKIFFTSDTHFNHANIIEYCKRPFKDIIHMNESMIENWNRVVSPRDIVYHLGDFAMGDKSKIPSILSRLNGHIILICGNHDHKKSLDFFPEVRHTDIIQIGEHQVELIHNPSHAKTKNSIVLCGHVHEKWAFKKKKETVPADIPRNRNEPYNEFVAQSTFINVGVDVRDFVPKTFEQLIKDSGVFQ
jgi:calcineurin-like phosphoesterase family protein